MENHCYQTAGKRIVAVQLSSSTLPAKFDASTVTRAAVKMAFISCSLPSSLKGGGGEYDCDLDKQNARMWVSAV